MQHQTNGRTAESAGEARSGGAQPPVAAVIALAADAGRVVLENGGETYRAEETMDDLCRSLGAADPESYATPTGVMLSAGRAEGESCSVVRRIKRRAVNLERITRTERLRRSALSGKVGFAEARAELGRIEHSAAYPVPVVILAAGIGAAFFALLYGGVWRDAVAACIIGLVLKAALIFLSRNGVADFFANIAGGAIVALVALVLSWCGLVARLDKTIIGALMILVPGLAIVNAIRDTITGDLVAGLARGIDALITATAVSIGTAIVLTATGLFGAAQGGITAGTAGTSSVSLAARFLLPALFSLVATAGFTVIFNLNPRDIPLAALGGAVGWLFYLLALGSGRSDVIAIFAASVVTGLYTETAAAILKRPATVFIVSAILPLVPGGGMYYTMEAAIRGDQSRALSVGFSTLLVAGAIAVGLAIASSIFRIFTVRRRGR